MTDSSTRPRRFQQVDVFTAVPYLGNPIAVVLDGEGLSDEQMQQFARWTNLSETTFVLPPTDGQSDYRLRIFTPGAELPFAGHPTLGSAHAWLAAGGQAREPGVLRQQCGVGVVTLGQQAEGNWAFAAPPLRAEPVTRELLAQVERALGITHMRVSAAEWLDNGPCWLALLLDSPETVHALAPDHAALKRLGVKVGVAAVGEGGDARPDERAGDTRVLQVRAFAAAVGVEEDPVTGSLNASLAQWLMGKGLLPARYQAFQGRALGRDGRVQLTRDAQGQVWVGGQCVGCIAGEVRL